MMNNILNGTRAVNFWSNVDSRITFNQFEGNVQLVLARDPILSPHLHTW